MAITFRIPRVLQQRCAGMSEFSLDGGNVRELLQHVKFHYPELYSSICDETGHIRPHVNLFINDQLLTARQGLDAMVESGDVVSVFQAVSGG